jgi:hypothetical protein
MSQSSDITLDDVRRIVTKTAAPMNGILNMSEKIWLNVLKGRMAKGFGIDVDIERKENEIAVIKFTKNDLFSKIDWKECEANLDFQQSVDMMSMEELEAVLKTVPEGNVFQRSCVVNSMNRLSMNASADTMIARGTSVEELVKIANKPGDDWKTTRERDEAVKAMKELGTAEEEILVSKSMEELAAMKASIRDTDPEAARRKEIIDGAVKRKNRFEFEKDAGSKSDGDLAMARDSLHDDPDAAWKEERIDGILERREEKRAEDAALAAAKDRVKRAVDTFNAVKAEYATVKGKAKKTAIADKLDWEIDVAKGMIARARLDGKEPEITGEHLKEMEARARLVKAAMFGLEKGIGYEYGHFYETCHPTDICYGFPSVRDTVHASGDDTVDVIVTDHELTDQEVILVALEIGKKEDGRTDEALEILEREDLEWKSWEEKESEDGHAGEDDDGENDDDDDGDDTAGEDEEGGEE